MTLRQAINDRGLNQNAVAAHLSVSAASVSKWVNGRAPVPSTYLRRLASLLGVEVEALLPAAATAQAEVEPVAIQPPGAA